MASPNPDIEYLKSLQAVRERSRIVFKAANDGKLNNFDYHPDKFAACADLVESVIRRDFGPDRFEQIPRHGRWQHFNVGGVDRVESLLQQWRNEKADDVEIVRRLVDLFFVSVLLDAGAGDVWKYQEAGGASYGRSEGIAVASLYMFKAAAFGQQDGTPIVDGQGLKGLTTATFNEFFQISDENPIIGADSRVGLLNKLGSSLLDLPDIFGPTGRPGCLADHLLKNAGEGAKSLDYEVLWQALQEVLLPSWPANRTRIDDVPIGDAWPLEVHKQQASGEITSTNIIQPFHKLTQWLGYSLTLPFVNVLGLAWDNEGLGTGLPEYRNGGLFVDTGVLSLKESINKQGLEASGKPLPLYSATSDTMVEWRAMTVVLLDELHGELKKRFAKDGVVLSLAQMLEAGSWKTGRELAAKYRPETCSSPILIAGDGTLF
ncbi:hypothetical protein F5X68DRAFT_216014 [Plectosphaerella plurivora]|uniref:DUF1688-domain-containing protein n=1 Tax=Plectosphaerella plurivora TaxID=936078 RepID=A0A9P8V2Z3_9PEZI|nr:hypothetical protein F5X68DRAFT_216014 [Plectosphaerella plurivora]